METNILKNSNSKCKNIVDRNYMNHKETLEQIEGVYLTLRIQVPRISYEELKI